MKKCSRIYISDNLSIWRGIVRSVSVLYYKTQKYFKRIITEEYGIFEIFLSKNKQYVTINTVKSYSIIKIDYCGRGGGGNK